MNKDYLNAVRFKIISLLFTFFYFSNLTKATFFSILTPSFITRENSVVKQKILLRLMIMFQGRSRQKSKVLKKTANRGEKMADVNDKGRQLKISLTQQHACVHKENCNAHQIPEKKLIPR